MEPTGPTPTSAETQANSPTHIAHALKPPGPRVVPCVPERFGRLFQQFSPL